MSGTSNDVVCRTDGRRARIRAAQLGGVDAVEVGDDGLTLTVTFLGKAPHGLCPENIRIDGGRRITEIAAVEVSVEREEDPELDDRLLVTVDRAGDTSRYRLSVVDTDPYGLPGTEPFPGFDQRYFWAEFEFRPDCPTPFDCKDAQPDCPPVLAPAPLIDYTARDYDTIRRLILDRLALTTPDWVERNAADLGTTLVELLAHTADRISYQQDAVATEAYLDTARRRVSVRRHVRLIDYPMHDGVNARAFVAVEATGELTLLPGTFRFAAVDVRTLGPRDRPEIGTVIDDRDLAVLDERGSVEVFEPVVGHDPLVLRPGHNTIRFWTWSDEVCSLPKGAVSATLRDEWADEECAVRTLELAAGDLLLIEEVRGARSGTPGDADPGHRQAVRLTSVTPAVDRLADQPVLEVTWAQEDALAFPVRLSTRGGPGCEPVEDVSVARGNVALVDHGRSLTFCDSAPETVTVPPAPAVLGSCDPSGFGCWDRDAGNETADLINSRLDQTRSGRLLTADQIRELFTVVGEDATGRAGLGLELAGRRREKVVPGTGYEQAEALATLLAQVVYPGIPARFRPVLQRSPVVQSVPFPDTRHVSAGQASRLAAVPGRVRQRLVELWRSARDCDGLTEPEIAELTVLFGLRVLERLELRRHPVRALRELLHRSERLLAAKLRRLEVLSARARAGAVLDAGIAWEIAHTWGPEYAAGLHPDEPVLRGPAAALVQDARAALPAVTLTDDDERWTPKRDLLSSGPRERHFVGELEDDGRIALRFRDGRHGARPQPGARLGLHYRLGGGTAGNVGAEAINHLVLCRDPEESDAGDPMPVAGVRNPLPAVGGTEPEPVEQVRQLAPLDLKRTRLRAVTAEDYAALASQLPGVQRAAAEIRWTGSVQEAHVAVDALGAGDASPELLDSVSYALESYRRIGHDLVVGPARSVPLDIALAVCAAPGHQHGQILAELYRLLGSRRLSGGRLGFFHPDALSFGEPVRLSRLVAAAAGVQGVESVTVTRLSRLFHEDPLDHSALEAGVLRLGPLEIARCDNDPDRPESGRLTIELGGGAR
ncbi:putative baseplate assembly protein [Streptomyces lunaelactis]|uniref:putative baseplate assembly protein n=1 Tax=Streptomyces lunaelactis TaxID=1535768 RepID=UPI001585AB02|nr:putative baseplate assembly protein [Streptomyces lunaelactis]NUK34184.1 putative baseplate assembly protein [Streptomyces lunaelactis]NUK40092.1 putative baseplate assembly protein [Streptomyces lunaelactis]NUK91038.1 putative baseplate assembly protein [Streptomyces lunaelactis]